MSSVAQVADSVKSIKFLDLKSINETYEPELSNSILRAVQSGWYLLGEENKAFEQEWCKYIGEDCFKAEICNTLPVSFKRCGIWLGYQL